MRKQPIFTAALFTAGAILVCHAQAQQAPATNTQQAPASSTPQKPSTTPKKAPAKKTGQTSAAKTPLTLKTDKDKVSYAIGENIGKSLKRDSVDIDPAILLRGMKDALAGDKLLMTDQEVQTALTALQTDIRKKQQLAQEQAAENNKKEGDAFLAANKAKEGVVTLPSGLQYKVLEEGTGPKPSANDMVTVNYRGALLNGTEFDSSYKRGQPASFGVGQVIKGWTEALQLMPVGSKWQIFIPPDLAYGPRGAGPNIGPNSALVFEVELLSIQQRPAPPAIPAPGPREAPPITAPATTPTPTPTPTTKP